MSTFGTAADDRVTGAWRAHRSYLLSLAYGMLNDLGAAEDAVQEAFTRFSLADLDAIKEDRAWLVVVTSRICLDQIGSARSRRERAHELESLERVGRPLAQQPPVDPADRVTLDDEVSLALLVLLQRLRPDERVVFLLHDVFQLPFDTIAETVGKSSATCRQLARRARGKVAGDSAWRMEIDAGQHRMVAERFITACHDGDLDALVDVLAPDAWGDVDMGPRDRRTGRTARGAEQVAKSVLYYMRDATMVSHPVAGDDVVLCFVDGELYAVMVLDVDGEVVSKLHVITDPDKLALVRPPD